MKNRFENELVKLNFIKEYSKQDSAELMNGVSAMNMEDKWNILLEDYDINFYRSWTGIGLYKIKMDSVNSVVKEAYVDKKFLDNYSQEYCSDLLNWIIEVVVLKRQCDLPTWDYDSK